MSRVIVVGAGSAGMTLAWRLSANPGVDVILIEAGVDPGPDVPGSLRREMLLPPEYYWPYSENDTGAFLPRGKVMGGSSAVNAAAAVRGQRWCFDSWDIPEWNWERCLPAFIALEHDQQFGSAGFHGNNGPIPITRFEPGAFDTAFADAYQQLGHKAIDDHNAPEAIGFAPWPTNRVGQDRASTLLQFLPDLRTRNNVSICSGVEVREVTFSGTCATGVLVTTSEGKKIIEGDAVVLSAGSFGSPELLFASGIGAADELRREGLDVRVDSPGVGKNLSDHAFLQIVVDVTDTERNALPAGQGILLTFGLSDPGHLAHLFAYQTAFFDPAAAPNQASVTASLMSPQSRGRLEFAPGQPARVYLGHYTHPDDVRHGLEILAHTREVIDRVAAAGLIDLPREGWWLADDPGPLLRNAAVTYHHPAGTCRMGTDRASVVDPSLRVRGAENLYVADASIMPKLPRATPNLATMMIGWRAADLLSARESLR